LSVIVMVSGTAASLLVLGLTVSGAAPRRRLLA
jgi:hypothetical protein